VPVGTYLEAREIPLRAGDRARATRRNRKGAGALAGLDDLPKTLHRRSFERLGGAPHRRMERALEPHDDRRQPVELPGDGLRPGARDVAEGEDAVVKRGELPEPRVDLLGGVPCGGVPAVRHLASQLPKEPTGLTLGEPPKDERGPLQPTPRAEPSRARSPA
jgi:hypothetical protein